MVAGHFRIRRNAADRLVVELEGDLDQRIVLDCDAEVRAQLSVAKPGGVKVVIDLLGVVGYSIEARDELVSLQRFLGAKASQTAFVTASTAGRSLALWIAHMTEGQVIKAVSNHEAAVAWFAGASGPTTGVRPVVPRDRDGATPRRRRRAAS